MNSKLLNYHQQIILQFVALNKLEWSSKFPHTTCEHSQCFPIIDPYLDPKTKHWRNRMSLNSQNVLVHLQKLP